MHRFVRLSSFFGWLLLCFSCAAIFLISSFFLYLNPDLPSIEQLKDVQLQTPLRIYTKDQKKIAEFGEKRRTPVSIDAVPEAQLNAFLAAEDSRFYEHQGIDFIGLGRAVTQLLLTGEKRSGGSTITMQVARNFFFSNKKEFTRKFKEILLAIKIEQFLSKREIFELYLNKIYLGHRAYGIQAAAQVYYGKDIRDLSLAQHALIAGLPKAPSTDNPLTNPSKAVARRNWILDRMLELKMISENEHASAKQEPLTAEYHGGAPDSEAPYIAEMARQEVIARYGAEAYDIGLSVYLTVDSTLQQAANTALRNGIEAYDRRHGYRGPISTLSDPQLTDGTILRQALADIKTPRGHLAAAVLKVSAEQAELINEEGAMIQLTLADLEWAAPFISRDRVGRKPSSVSDVLARGHVVLVRPETDEEGIRWRLTQIPEVQGALVSVDPQTGAILALSGGYDFSLSNYNRAAQAKRQPGSSFKPFIYLAGLESGMSAATLINDAPIVFEDKNLESTWRPTNDTGRFYGPTRLRQALYNSRNLVSIRLLQQVGIDKTLNLVRKFGLADVNFPRELSVALGTAELTPLKLTSAYAMLANGGYFIETHLIDRIETSNGEIIYQTNPMTVCPRCGEPDINLDPATPALRKAPRIADERSVYILHSMMKDVIQKGTGRAAKAMQRDDLAGKTGTTNDQKDAWFAGFNTRVATTAWIGFDNPEPLGRREYGGTAALPFWIEFMRTALKGIPNSHMAQPEGIVSARINPETGELADPGDPNAIFELFRSEMAPRPRRFYAPDTSETPSGGETIQLHDIF